MEREFFAKVYTEILPNSGLKIHQSLGFKNDISLSINKIIVLKKIKLDVSKIIVVKYNCGISHCSEEDKCLD